ASNKSQNNKNGDCIELILNSLPTGEDNSQAQEITLVLGETDTASVAFLDVDENCRAAPCYSCYGEEAFPVTDEDITIFVQAHKVWWE
ncbi:hypothetical protein ACQP3L_33640, partial [Escherichia coli]